MSIEIDGVDANLSNLETESFKSMIKKAVATLKASGDNQYKLDKNDFFYNGDVAKWIKFGNTLRVLMAQRLEKADVKFSPEIPDTASALFWNFMLTVILPFGLIFLFMSFMMKKMTKIQMVCTK